MGGIWADLHWKPGSDDQSLDSGKFWDTAETDSQPLFACASCQFSEPIIRARLANGAFCTLR